MSACGRYTLEKQAVGCADLVLGCEVAPSRAAQQWRQWKHPVGRTMHTETRYACFGRGRESCGRDSGTKAALCIAPALSTRSTRARNLTDWARSKNDWICLRLGAAAHHRACQQAGGWQGRRLARPLASIESHTSAPHPRKMASSGTWGNKSFLVFSQLVSKNNKHVLEHLTSLVDLCLPKGVPAQPTESLSTRALTASTKAVSRSSRPMTCAIFCRRTSAGILRLGNGEAGLSSFSAPTRLFCSPSA